MNLGSSNRLTSSEIGGSNQNADQNHLDVLPSKIVTKKQQDRLKQLALLIHNRCKTVAEHCRGSGKFVEFMLLTLFTAFCVLINALGEVGLTVAKRRCGQPIFFPVRHF